MEVVLSVEVYFKRFRTVLLTCRLVNDTFLLLVFSFDVVDLFFAHHTSVLSEITIALFCPNQLVELEHIAVVVLQHPRKHWILAEIIKTATAELVDQKKELHIRSLSVLPLVLVLFNVFEVVDWIFNQSKWQFFTFFCPFLNKLLYVL